MQNYENQSKPHRLYDKPTRTGFEVPADVYESYTRECNTHRKKMQDHGLCNCPRKNWWLCDMVCMDCEYRKANTISLDAPQGEDEDTTLMDVIPDGRTLLEDDAADRDLLARLIARLRELDPEADTILALWQENDSISDRAIAKALGRPQRTFADQMKRIRTELRKVRGY